MRRALRLLAAAMLAACANSNPAPLPTEPSVRARFTPEHAAGVLTKIENPVMRDVLRRHFIERSRAAGRMSLTLDDVRVGERMNIGGGMALERVFALYHEHDERRFTTYLEGIEMIGGRVQGAYRQTVGGSGAGLAAIEFTELNRVILKRYVAQADDAPCCPTKLDRIGFTLTGAAMETLQ